MLFAVPYLAYIMNASSLYFITLSILTATTLIFIAGLSLMESIVLAGAMCLFGVGIGLMTIDEWAKKYENHPAIKKFTDSYTE